MKLCINSLYFGDILLLDSKTAYKSCSVGFEKPNISSYGFESLAYTYPIASDAT